jgi:hypothetical protein
LPHDLGVKVVVLSVISKQFAPQPEGDLGEFETDFTPVTNGKDPMTIDIG